MQYEKIKKLIYVMIMFSLFAVFFLVGENYATFKEEGDTYINMFDKEVYEWGYNEKPPQEYLEKVAHYNRIVRISLFIVFLNLLYYFVEYKQDPNNHWFTKLKEKLRRLEE